MNALKTQQAVLRLYLVQFYIIVGAKVNMSYFFFWLKIFLLLIVISLNHTITVLIFTNVLIFIMNLLLLKLYEHFFMNTGILCTCIDWLVFNANFWNTAKVSIKYQSININVNSGNVLSKIIIHSTSSPLLDF